MTWPGWRPCPADARIVIGPTLAEEVNAVAGPPTVVIDMLWGEPLVSVLPVLAPRGSSTWARRPGRRADAVGPDPWQAARPARVLRLRLPCSVFADGYRELVDLVVAGEIVMSVQRFPLTEVADAWRAAASGAARSWSTSLVPAADVTGQDRNRWVPG